MASEIKVDTIVNAGGDNDTGIDLATNDNIKFDIAGSQKAMIDSSGNVGIGTSTIGEKLTVAGSIKSTSRAIGGSSTAGVTLSYDSSNSIAKLETWDSKPLSVETAGAERMRIDSSGRLLVGRTSTSGDVTNSGTIVNPAGKTIITNNGDSAQNMVLAHYNSVGSPVAIEFYRNSSVVGSITKSTSSTAYNTSSDYRLKENVVTDWDATTRLKQLKPSRFNFIADADTTVDGFLAHEVSDVVPEAISGEKDAVDADGNPEYQGIDQAKLVPLLTKALQEAVAKIETLEARITALESE